MCVCYVALVIDTVMLSSWLKRLAEMKLSRLGRWLLQQVGVCLLCFLIDQPTLAGSERSHREATPGYVQQNGFETNGRAVWIETLRMIPTEGGGGFKKRLRASIA